MYLTEIELQIYKKEIFGFDAIKSRIHVLFNTNIYCKSTYNLLITQIFLQNILYIILFQLFIFIILLALMVNNSHF